MNFGRLHCEIRVTIRSPFLFKGLDVAGHGFDASALRDEGGHLIVPGDHVRGHLRHALEVLEPKMVKHVFGEGSKGSRERDAEENSDKKPEERKEHDPALRQDKPQRGALLLGDLRGPLAERVAIYHRVALDERTGAAKEGSIQLIELPAPIGKAVTFTGSLVLRPREGYGTEEMRAALDDALRLVPAMGALKSSGFGEVVAAECAVISPPPPGAAFPQGHRWEVTVSFDRPLLVDSEMVDSNVFRGRSVIPGGAIKGSLAEMLRDGGHPIEASTDFTRLRIGHAFPLAGGRLADRAVPDALALAGDAWCLAPNDAELAMLAKKAAPAFPGDWKDAQFEQVRKAIGRPGSGLEHVSRGRVRIGEDGVAVSGALFVVQPVASRGHLWRFTLDIEKCPEPILSDVKAALMAGLDGVGRTGARMVVIDVAAAPIVQPVRGKKVLLMLETPAVLTNPEDETPLFEQYDRAFQHLAGAQLLRCWARQKMDGHYHAYRFRAFGAGQYQPFEVTEAGAVFELAAEDLSRLDALVHRGLPAMLGPDRTLTWEDCPFVPENGYGDLSVITDLLSLFRPEKQDA